jgi:hypothetical protein
MNKSSKVFAAVAAATFVAGALAACSDGFTSAPRRVDTVPAVDASRQIPAQYAWVGDEHNRFVSLALAQYDIARQRGDRARRDVLRRDCGALWDLMSSEVHASARRGGFAGREDALLSLVRNATLPSGGCDRLTSNALALFPGLPAEPRLVQAAAIGDGQPWEMIQVMLNQISVARSPTEVRRILGDAAASASAMSPRDAEVAYSVLSLVRGSFEHWSAVLPGRHTALSLFLQDTAGTVNATTANLSWSGILATVSADVGGCTGGAQAVRTVDSSAGWTSVAGGCLIGGGVASAGAAIAYK